MLRSRDEEILGSKIPSAPTTHTSKPTGPANQPTSRCYEHFRREIAAPTTTLRAFMNEAG
jgi:hypothetical protein